MCPRIFRHFPDRERFINLSLGIGKVLRKEFTDRATVEITLNRLNKMFNIYFPEKSCLEVYDPKNISAPGDRVIVKKLPKIRKNTETHVIQEVFFKAGFIIDPVTGKRVDRDVYLDEKPMDMDTIRQKYEEVASRETVPYYAFEVLEENKLWNSNFVIDTCLGGDKPREKMNKKIDQILEDAKNPPRTK